MSHATDKEAIKANRKVSESKTRSLLWEVIKREKFYLSLTANALLITYIILHLGTNTQVIGLK